MTTKAGQLKLQDLKQGVTAWKVYGHLPYSKPSHVRILGRPYLKDGTWWVVDVEESFADDGFGRVYKNYQHLNDLGIPSPGQKGFVQYNWNRFFKTRKQADNYWHACQCGHGRHKAATDRYKQIQRSRMTQEILFPISSKRESHAFLTMNVLKPRPPGGAIKLVL